MRKFEPYGIGEEVGLLQNRKGRIRTILADGNLFDVELTDNVAGDDDVMPSVPVEDLYRSIPFGGTIDVGMKGKRKEKELLG